MSEPMTLRASATYPVTVSAIVRYAGASGDFTAFHFDPEALAEAGYERFFAMGMLVAGHMGTLVASIAGDEAVREFSVRFREQSWVGSPVTVQLHDTDEVDRFELRALTDDGSTIATGSARVHPAP